MNTVIRVLLIDDDPMVRTGLRMILANDPDLEVIGEAPNGLEGLDAIAAHRPDVVLSDIRMPVLDGIGLLERLGPDDPPVLVLTTFNTDEYVVRALQQGAKGFLLKDADPPQMIAAVRAVAAGQPVLSPEVTQTLIAAATTARPENQTAVAALDSLTEREREVALLVARGLSNADIGRELYMSLATVKANLTRVFGKLGVDNRVAVAMRVRDAGLT